MEDTRFKKVVDSLMPDYKKLLKVYPDFPKKGVDFIDIHGLFKDDNCIWSIKECFLQAILLDDVEEVDAVLGIDARGFYLAPLMALEVHCAFIPVRKKGKLPSEVISIPIKKEYGSDVLEIQKAALNGVKCVHIHDDVLATGGTLAALVKQIRSMGITISSISTLVEIEKLKGRNKLPKDIPIHSIFKM